MQQTRAPDRKKEKETNTSHDEPKRHIVLSGKRNIVGVEDKTDALFAATKTGYIMKKLHG